MTDDGNGHKSGVDYESQPLERGDYITAIIHLYRGEITRANTWRLRLDQTTNWAVFTTATALGFGFNDPGHSHWALQFANLLLIILLIFEARRYRYFDVWRARIRMIETNFYGPILERRLASPEVHWGKLIANDLNEPSFHLTAMQAIRRRLVKNYLPIFGVILVAWIIKVVIHPMPVKAWADVVDRFRLGDLPPWVGAAPVALFYVLLFAFSVRALRDPAHRDNWDIQEKVPSLDA